jgi:hypothetical protein
LAVFQQKSVVVPLLFPKSVNFIYRQTIDRFGACRILRGKWVKIDGTILYSSKKELNIAKLPKSIAYI